MTMFDFSSVYQAYVACRRGKRMSHNTQRYEVRLLDHLVRTSQALLSRRWLPSRSVSFVCKRPKAREIHAADFADRVVHHILVPKLEAIYEQMFIHDSYSNRKGKGTHLAVDRLQQFMRKISRNGKHKAYFLQLDIRNFFNRINRQVLLGLLQKRCAKALAQGHINVGEYDEMFWLCTVLLENNAAENALPRGSPASFGAVPPYKRLSQAPDHCGIAIGNLTSQFFANVYLNELDQFIKHDLKCRYYLRYVDDFVLLHASEAQLLMWRTDVQQFLADKLYLDLKDVASPQPVSVGCDFLGYITRPKYKLVRRRVLHHCIEKLDDFQREMIRTEKNSVSIHLAAKHRDALHATLASYFGHYSHANAFKLEQSIFAQFPWLHHCFELRDTDKHTRKLFIRWAPLFVSSFQGQFIWFQTCFKGFVQLVQVGHGFACLASELHCLPLAMQRTMRKMDIPSLTQAMYIAPLARLKAVRSFLRQSRVAHVFVAEEGYLGCGMKKRVLRLLWQPHPVIPHYDAESMF